MKMHIVTQEVGSKFVEYGHESKIKVNFIITKLDIAKLS